MRRSRSGDQPPGKRTHFRHSNGCNMSTHATRYICRKCQLIRFLATNETHRRLTSLLIGRNEHLASGGGRRQEMIPCPPAPSAGSGPPGRETAPQRRVSWRSAEPSHRLTPRTWDEAFRGSAWPGGGVVSPGICRLASRTHAERSPNGPQNDRSRISEPGDSGV